MFDPFYIVVALTFVVVISILVAAHELGHYWFARLFGMEVEAFAVNVGGIRATDLSSRLKKPLAKNSRPNMDRSPIRRTSHRHPATSYRPRNSQ